MAVFFKQERSALDLTIQELRQHARVVPLIEPCVRPRELIEKDVDGTSSYGNTKQDATALVAGQLPSGWIGLFGGWRRPRRGRAGRRFWGRSDNPARSLPFDRS
jgi:hypothetical protein